MNTQQAKKKIDQLTQQIKEYNKAFFQSATSLISDYAFDQLVKELEALEQAHPTLRHSDSPTQQIGEQLMGYFHSKLHTFPMRSLRNSYSIEEIISFLKRAEKIVGSPPWPLYGELKLDGIALSLTYQKGVLQNILTRGDGWKGDDITHHTPLLNNLPRKLSANINCCVHGEAFMYKQDFADLNRQLTFAGKTTFANPRNLTSGTLKTLASQQVMGRKLQFYPYSLHSSDDQWNNHSEQLHQLQAWGFSLSPHRITLHSMEEIEVFLKQWHEQRTTLPMEIDGVVLKINRLNWQQQLGNTSKHPRWAIAYKYPPTQAASQLIEINYQVGRTGVITPVATIAPVTISGSCVQHASLYNAQQMKLLSLHEGDWVYVEKGGEIIPKISGVDISKRTEGAKELKFISNCPSCKTALTTASKAQRYCPNKMGCSAQQYGSVVHFVSKAAMDITHLGPKRIKQLFKADLLHTPSDLYNITLGDLLSIEGLQETSAQRLLKSIAHSKKQSLHRWIFALGIRHIGEQLSSTIATHFQNIEKIEKASKEEWLTIDEIGEESAISLYRYFHTTSTALEVNRLKQHGLATAKSIGKFSKKANKAQSLAGKKMVITGSFAHYDRNKLKSIIVSAGGSVATSISKEVMALVCGQAPGPKKIKEANALQIPIWSIEQLENYLSLIQVQE